MKTHFIARPKDAILNSTLVKDLYYKWKALAIPLTFFLSICCLWLIVIQRPTLPADNSIYLKEKDIKFPTCLEDVKKLLEMLTLFKENHFLYIYILFSFSYIFKQTFAIPGSALLNILAGALFGCWPFGLLFCSLLTAIGASNCFLLSKVAGRDLIRYYFPAQIKWLEEKLIENEGQLIWYLISLRLFPATPNWLINIVSPIVNVPWHLFFVSVFVGLLPYNLLCMKAGEMLAEIDSLDDIFTPKRLFILFGLAAGVFTLSYFSKKRQKKFN